MLIEEGLASGCDAATGSVDVRAVVLLLAHDLDLLLDAAMAKDIHTTWLGADAIADSLKPDLVISSECQEVAFVPFHQLEL